MEILQLLCDKVFDVPEVRLVRVPQMHLVVFPEVLTVVGMPVVFATTDAGGTADSPQLQFIVMALS